MTPRDRYLRKTYGITEDQYYDIISFQGGGCFICGKTEEQEGRKLCVDHNHKTGAVRGVLCFYCNHRVVGRHTDPDLLRRTSEYLSQETGFFVPKKQKTKKRRKRRRK